MKTTMIKKLNGVAMPGPKNLVIVSRASIGLPPAGSFKEMPIVKKNGGARPGAGRKKIGRRPILLRLLWAAENRLRVTAKKKGISLSEAAEELILR